MWEEDSMERVKAAIKCVTNLPTHQVALNLLQETAGQEDIFARPTLTRLLALKDRLLIPDHKWGEVVDTFGIEYASLTAIRRYDLLAML